MSSPYRSGSVSPLAVPLGPAILVHEDPTEEIQGGAVGEHYHLTAAQLAFIQQAQVVGSRVYEPVMAASELVLVGGDCVVAWGGSYAA